MQESEVRAGAEAAPSDATTSATPQGATGSQPAQPVVDPLSKVIPTTRVLVTTREELDEVIARHRRWIDSVLSPRVDVHEGRANLTGSDLSGFDLTGVNLSGATLSGCRLIGTIFRNTNLRGANLSHVDAQGADFRGARLQKANFERADLRGAEFEGADVTGTDFKFARRGERQADDSAETQAADPASTQTEVSAESGAMTGQAVASEEFPAAETIGGDSESSALL